MVHSRKGFKVAGAFSVHFKDLVLEFSLYSAIECELISTVRLSASHELLKFVQLKRRYRRETGVWPKWNQKTKEIDFDLACNSFSERGLLGGASHFPMLHANGTPMPSSVALLLAAVVTVLEPAQSTDIPPSTAFQSVLESYHLDAVINRQTLGVVSGFGH